MSAQKGYGTIVQLLAVLFMSGAVIQTNRLRRDRKAQEEDHTELVSIARRGLDSASVSEAQKILQDFRARRKSSEDKWVERKHPDYTEMQTTTWGDVFKGREVQSEAKTKRQQQEEADVLEFLQRLSKPKPPEEGKP